MRGRANYRFECAVLFTTTPIHKCLLRFGRRSTRSRIQRCRARVGPLEGDGREVAHRRARLGSDRRIVTATTLAFGQRCARLAVSYLEDDRVLHRSRVGHPPPLRRRDATYIRARLAAALKRSILRDTPASHGRRSSARAAGDRERIACEQNSPL